MQYRPMVFTTTLQLSSEAQTLEDPQPDKVSQQLTIYHSLPTLTVTIAKDTFIVHVSSNKKRKETQLRKVKASGLRT